MCDLFRKMTVFTHLEIVDIYQFVNLVTQILTLIIYQNVVCKS